MTAADSRGSPDSQTPANQNKATQLLASKLGARLFRMNTGLAWVSSKVQKVTRPGTVSVMPGDIVLRQGRPFKSGTLGISDETGWLSVVITPEMVGQTIAQYVAIEDKQGSGRLSTEQAAFIDAVIRAGGRAGVARSPDDVRRILGAKTHV